MNFNKVMSFSCDVEFQAFRGCGWSPRWCRLSCALNEHAEQIETFDVRMSATSRQEDKDMIMAKIPCVDTFNEVFHDLLLGSDHGLLSRIRTEFETTI